MGRVNLSERSSQAVTFRPSSDDDMAADIAIRIGCSVWIQRTTSGLFWAILPMPLQRH